MRIVFWIVLLTAAVSAQDAPDAQAAVERRVVRHTATVVAGQYVDLDSGTVLSRPQVGELKADLAFVGSGHRLAWQLLTTAGDQTDVPLGAPFSFTTDGGGAAELTSHPLGTQHPALSVITWSLLPGGGEIPAIPTGVSMRWKDGHYELDGLGPAWLVVAKAAGKSKEWIGSGGTLRVLELAANTPHRFEVSRVVAKVASAPFVITCEPKPRVVHAVVSFEGRWFQKTGGLRLDPPKAFCERDFDVEFFLYGIHVPGGGIQKMGKGTALFRELLTLPATRYLPAHSSIRHDTVFAVRTRDGRYAKLHLTGVNGDIRNGMSVRIAYIASGGASLPEPPSNLTWKRVRDGVRFSWDSPTHAVGQYVLTIGSLQFTTKETSLFVADLKADKTYTARLRADLASGASTGLISTELHTYPPSVTVGSFTINNSGESFSFDTLQVVAAPGDMGITNSAGGASSLRITLPHGGLSSRPYGDFTHDEPPSRKVNVNTDSRKPHTQSFLVRSAKGGLASVKIKTVDYPRVTFQYVFRTKRWSGFITRDGRTISWAPWPGAVRYVVTVPGQDPITTNKPTLDLKKLPRNQEAVRLEIQAFPKAGDPSPAVFHDVHTYSSDYLISTIRLGWKANPQGIYIRPSNRNEFLLIAPGGVSIIPRGNKRTFPRLGEVLATTKSARIAIAALPDLEVIAVTKDGDHASLRITVRDARRFQFVADMVLRKNVTLEQAYERLVEAGSGATNEQTAAARAAVSNLSSPNATRRRQAYQQLVELGPTAAPTLKLALEDNTTPDRSRLIRRWFVEAFERHLR